MTTSLFKAITKVAGMFLFLLFSVVFVGIIAAFSETVMLLLETVLVVCVIYIPIKLLS